MSFTVQEESIAARICLHQTTPFSRGKTVNVSAAKQVPYEPRARPYQLHLDTKISDDPWAAGPFAMRGRPVDDEFFDELRSANGLESKSLPELTSLIRRYAPSEEARDTSLLAEEQFLAVSRLLTLRSKVCLQFPIVIGSPYQYKDENANAAMELYAERLHIAAPTTLDSHARLHWLRNQICKRLLQDPIIEGNFVWSLFESFVRGI